MTPAARGAVLLAAALACTSCIAHAVVGDVSLRDSGPPTLTIDVRPRVCVAACSVHVTARLSGDLGALRDSTWLCVQDDVYWAGGSRQHLSDPCPEEPQRTWEYDVPVRQTSFVRVYLRPRNHRAALSQKVEVYVGPAGE